MKRAAIRRGIGKALRWAAPILEEALRVYLEAELQKRVPHEVRRELRKRSYE